MPEPPLKRILMTGDTVGGVWTFNLELAEALVPYGIEVILAALGGEPSVSQRADAARIPSLRLLTSDFKLEWMDDPWEDVAASGRWLLDLERQYQPDLVHLNSYGQGALAWQSPVLLTAHSCVVSWWEAVKREPLPEQWRRYRTEVERAIRMADVLTAPSGAMMQSIEQHYLQLPVGCGTGGAPDRLVIPNGRAAGRFRASSKEPFILTAGRLRDQAKNAGAIAKAARDLPWSVYLAGDSADLEGCRALGQLSTDALAGWYARASIYALPARYEPFGLSILEAALAECALVLGDIASLRENWEGAAIFVPPDDPPAIARAIGELIADNARRNALARRASARAREFTPQRMAEGFLTAYAGALKRRTVCAS